MTNQLNHSINQLLESTNEGVRIFRIGEFGLGYAKTIEIIEKTILFFKFLEENCIFEEEDRELINEMNSIFNQLSQALISRDDVLIADLLEYEFVPIVEKIRDSIIH